MADKWGMNRPHISKPKNPMHRKGALPPFFARPITGERLEDCCEWISYCYKNRPKEALPFREVYANSTWKANDAKQEAMVAAAIEHQQESKGDTNQEQFEVPCKASSNAETRTADGGTSPSAGSTARSSMVSPGCEA